MRFWRILIAVAVIAGTIRSTVGAGVMSENVWSALQLVPVVLIAVLGLVGRPDQKRTPEPFVVAFWIFATVAALSIAQSGTPHRTALQVGTLVLVGSALFATVSRRWTTPERMRADVHWLARLLVAIHVVGLIGHLGGSAWAHVDYYDRYHGLYYNANYAGLTAALALIALLATRRGVIDIVPMSVAVVALFASGSRGGMVAALIGVAVLAVMPATRARLLVYAWAASLATVVAALLNLGLPTFVTDFIERVKDGSDPTSGRLDIYSMFWQRWQESPVFGTGYQTGRITVASSIDGRDAHEVYAHNVYLSTLVETGILGAVALAVLVVVVFRQARRRDPLAALVVAILIYELTESTLFGFGNPVALVEWLFIASYAASGQSQERPVEHPGAHGERLPPAAEQRRSC